MEASNALSAAHANSPTSTRNRFELLVMSEAGKPIYSFTKREDAVTLMPLCSTLIDFAQKTQKETLHSMRTSDNLVIEFTTRSPLIIIVAHEANSFIDSLVLVEQVEAQIIAILTAKTLRTVFLERPTYDLKRLLYGSEKLIDSLTTLCTTFGHHQQWTQMHAFLAVSSMSTTNSETKSTSSSNSASITSSSTVGSNSTKNSSSSMPIRPHRVLIPIVVMSPSVRDSIHNIMSNTISSNSKNIIFSLLFKVIPSPDKNPVEVDESQETPVDDLQAETNHYARSADSKVTFQLITLCNHHNKHKLKLADIHLVIALLHGSKAQLATVESLWMPVCLPRFNENAFSHSYISYMNDMKNCLVMFSIDRDEFTDCKKSKDEIEGRLKSIIHDPNKMTNQVSPLVHPILLELQEKLVDKNVTEEELIEARQQTQIYNSKLELYHSRQLQFLWYQTKKQVLWWQRSLKEKQLNKVILYLTEKMLQTPFKTLWVKFAEDSIFLGWHVPTFQLYAQFDDTISTTEATEVVHRITSWIKKEEENFSIKDYR